ncbi:myo-inositol-1-monophosphatase [Xylogone sp. PMI_703]|nr:myo-inositol-1-monophosphatase [Xylogone sp. PMI_703]
MANINFQEIHDLLIEIAHEAGRMITAARPSIDVAGTKKNSADIVTETDQAVEKMVSTRLREAYPNFEFIGEETWKPGMKLTNAPTFIVDPIDGTTNFLHGFPHVCISLGFVLDKIPSVGVIYNPFLDELFTGIQGQGAFLKRPEKEKVRLPIREQEALGDLSTTLIGAEWGTDRQGVNFDVKVQTFTKLAAAKQNGGSMVHSLRALGSAALNLCMVASGGLDAYWEGGCWAWDVAAGWCILNEAGGVMVGANPGEWQPTVDGRLFLAVRPAPSGQKEFVQQFWDVIGDGRMVYES